MTWVIASAPEGKADHGGLFLVYQELGLTSADFVGYAIMLGVPLGAGLLLVAFLSIQKRRRWRNSK